MKMILFFLLVAPLFVFSQDSTVNNSKYEEFISRNGVMIKSETFIVTNTKDFKLEVFKSTDLESQKSLKSLTISQTKNMFLVGNIVTGILYVDWDEVEGFIKALKFQNDLFTSKPERDISYRYSTTNGVTSTCSYYLENTFGIQGWSLVLARVYKYSRAYVAGSSFYVKKKDLQELINLIENAYKKEY